MATLSIFRKEPPERDPERELRRLFEFRYSDLLGWARQLADFDQSVAQELVHDAYVALSTSRPDLDGIANLDGYLYRVLRNLNQSRIRRAWKHDHDSLDVVDYDSLYIRLHLSRGADQIDLQDRLMRLCVYLCWRKDSSRSASVLLLRFFRGFYPEEISRLAAMDHRAVRKQIERGRREAKAWLADPKKMTVIDGSSSIPSGFNQKQAVTLDAFIARIGTLIDLSKNGQCFSPLRLAEIYGDPVCSALDTAELGHLVACDQCLTSVCRFLSMNPPDDRLPLDPPGQDRESANKALDIAEHTALELRNHEPNTLILAVNGEDLYESQVSTGALRHILSPPNSSGIEFVEIFSQTGLRLLRLDVGSGPPDGPAEVWSHVTLGGRRTLSLGIEWYGPDPRIRVEFEEAPAELVEMEPLVAANGETFPHPASEIPRPQDDDSPWKKLVSSARAGWRWWFLPVIAFVAFGVFERFPAILHFVKPGRPAPATILASSTRYEAEAARAGVVSSQSIAFEERNDVGGLIQSGHIEVWRGTNREARRLFDASEKLIGGRWKDGHGESVTLSNGKLQAASSNEDCVSQQSAWACGLSATSFEALHGSSSKWSASETRDSYELDLVTTEAFDKDASAPHLMRAALHIDRSSSRAKEETFWIADHGTVRTYQFRELSYTPRTGVAPDSPLMRPEFDFPAPNKRPAKPIALPKEKIDLAHLHLQVLVSLHSIGADVGQPISIERKGGVLLVHGVVGSDEDAVHIRAVLAPFVNIPAFKEDVYSANEFIRREQHQTRPQRISAEEYEIAAVRIPAEVMLRSHFASVGFVGNQIDAQIETYTQTVLAQSATMLQRAWTLEQFSQGFSREELLSLPSADQRAWFALLNEHAANLNESLVALRRSLGWMQTLDTVRPAVEPLEPFRPDAIPIRGITHQLLNEAQNLDHLVRLALVASSVKGDDQVVDPQKMQRSLIEAQNEVLGIQKISQDYSAILRVP
jgi:RNA polymerase sigma factor (sigma-70 family)